MFEPKLIVVAFFLCCAVALFAASMLGQDIAYARIKPQIITKEVPIIQYVLSENSSITQEELGQANQIIDEGIHNHQYYIANPSKQIYDVTGHTTFNQLWVDNYLLLRDCRKSPLSSIEKKEGSRT